MSWYQSATNIEKLYFEAEVMSSNDDLEFFAQNWTEALNDVRILKQLFILAMVSCEAGNNHVTCYSAWLF